MTKQEFLDKYGNVLVRFSTYYKYSFTFAGETDNLTVTVSYGGSSDDIYRYDVSADVFLTVRDIDPNYGAVYDSEKNLIDTFYEY